MMKTCNSQNCTDVLDTVVCVCVCGYIHLIIHLERYTRHNIYIEQMMKIVEPEKMYTQLVDTMCPSRSFIRYLSIKAISFFQQISARIFRLQQRRDELNKFAQISFVSSNTLARFDGSRRFFEIRNFRYATKQSYDVWCCEFVRFSLPYRRGKGGEGNFFSSYMLYLI